MRISFNYCVKKNAFIYHPQQNGERAYTKFTKEMFTSEIDLVKTTLLAIDSVHMLTLLIH